MNTNKYNVKFQFLAEGDNPAEVFFNCDFIAPDEIRAEEYTAAIEKQYEDMGLVPAMFRPYQTIRSWRN